MVKILLVDDDKDIRDLQRVLLEPYVDEIIEAKNGKEAIEAIDETINLVIMDNMMPKMSGIDAVKEIRKSSPLPILFVSAKGQEYDKISGYSAGGDDYLVKPFSPQELQLKVQAMLRRSLEYSHSNQDTNEIKVRDLVINISSREVWVAHRPVNLTGKEFDVLKLLASRAGQVFSAEVIYEQVWQEPYYYNSSSTIMTHIKKLRQKLEENPKTPKYIQTIWGVGYKIEK
ncbi:MULTISPECIES: response regulator transcription factor [unclassified Enterococcus]|uniref:response regulator transcription factor n=1 Tax=unclassified Enterococcus TaxID=2608891 RepID=UPI0015535F4F|nr:MULTISPECIES: response regulator transcription factor [unclassified Enterococcus]MBS7578104.1 response regulator transcription factor [Enterococcus sp. MMGLQ5-2]MBS7585364.1 response regulator transcription factor [Enterococcus sp. MMGLQ5-1]NPD13221.1 response regulator transcription factor [Enterococcus sp. MMGLQ5-1]NPD37935.1 response regulator transcription factor [Enterococcus sp. MMGLQ5-2]